MYTLKFTSQFKRDVKLAKKQHKNIDKLFRVIDMIAQGDVLPSNYRDHALTGNYHGFRECHEERRLHDVYCRGTVPLFSTVSVIDLIFYLLVTASSFVAGVAFARRMRTMVVPIPAMSSVATAIGIIVLPVVARPALTAFQSSDAVTGVS